MHKKAYAFHKLYGSAVRRPDSKHYDCIQVEYVYISYIMKGVEKYW